MTTREDIGSRWSARGALWMGWGVLALLIGGFGYWGSVYQLQGAVIAMGQIEVEQNRQVVQHPDGGIVAEVLVKEGDTVEQGQLVIRLDSEVLLSDLAVTEGQLLEVLARRARFEAERDEAGSLVFAPLLLETDNPVAQELMDGQIRLFAARRETEAQEIEQLSRRREQIADQIRGIEAQKVSLARQLDLIGQELADQQSLLDRGLAQSGRVLELSREQARLSGQDGELTAAIAQAEGRITETEIEILRLQAARREEAITRLRDLQFNEIELSERRRALLTQLDRLDIRAPVGGIVYGLQVFGPQAVIRPADPVLFIVPQDRPLVITAQIEPIHIDEVRLDQQVTVRVAALDQRTTPELYGRVEQVSADAFQDQATRMSYYRARITLNPGEVERLPEGSVLIPGMPVEAFIETAPRTPLQYLLKPLMDYFTRAFRET